jgi:hypothetical protein
MGGRLAFKRCQRPVTYAKRRERNDYYIPDCLVSLGMQGVSLSNLIARLHHPVLGSRLAASQAGHSRNYVSQPSSEIRVFIVSYETRDSGTRRGPIDAGEAFGLRVVLVGGRTEVQDAEQVVLRTSVAAHSSLHRISAPGSSRRMTRLVSPFRAHVQPLLPADHRVIGCGAVPGVMVCCRSTAGNGNAALGTELPRGGLSVRDPWVPAVGVGSRSAGAVGVVPLLPGSLHGGHHLGQEGIVGVVRSDEEHFLACLLNRCLHSAALRHVGIVPPRTAACYSQAHNRDDPEQRFSQAS